MKKFNVRVYGILINERQEVLLSDECRFGFSFTKFPGGGLEWGEGLKDAVKREFQEEFQLEIEVGEQFYVNTFFQQSAFNEEDQIISFYFLVEAKSKIEILEHNLPLNQEGEFLRWQAISELKQEMLNFPIDKLVAEKIANSFVK